MRLQRLALALAACAMLAGCGATPKQPAAEGARYYLNDGPGDNPPAGLAHIPDAEPRVEALHRTANRPYQLFGTEYVPFRELRPYRQRGVASWYGRRFHGQRTASGEVYDMYSMTAAHPVLPIPSYARVTNLSSGKSIVVRVNDRGPFHAGRIIDLSYAAAQKLGFAEAGSAHVEVESILPGGYPVARVAPLAEPAVEPASPAPAPPAAPAAPLIAATAAVAPATEAPGVYLQLGAFAARENAESFRAHLQRELQWLSDAIQVLPSGNLFKLQLGPYPTRDDARPIAARIEGALNFAPLVVAR